MRNFCILLLLLLSACAGNSVREEEIPDLQGSYPVIDMGDAILGNPKYLWSEKIESIKLIPLETAEESVLGDIRQIIVTDSYIYISDSYRQGSVSVFTSEGKFVKRIPIGEGPEEISSAGPMYWDSSDGFLYVFDRNQRKISKFEPDGKFVSCCYTLDNRILDFFVNDGNYVFVNSSMLGPSYITKADSSFNVLRIWKSEPEPFAYIFSSYLQKCGNGFNIRYFLDNTIYFCNGDTVVRKYVVKNSSPEFNFSLYADYDDFMKSIPESGYVYTGLNHETEHFQVFDFVCGLWDRKFVYRGKATGESWRFKPGDGSVTAFFHPMGVADYDNDVFVSLLMAEDFSEGSHFHWDGENPGNLISDCGMEIIKSMSPDDNPVIVLVKFKSAD